MKVNENQFIFLSNFLDFIYSDGFNLKNTG
jgi:hypothetical protein